MKVEKTTLHFTEGQNTQGKALLSVFPCYINLCLHFIFSEVHVSLHDHDTTLVGGFDFSTIFKPHANILGL